MTTEPQEPPGETPVDPGAVLPEESGPATPPEETGPASGIGIGGGVVAGAAVGVLGAVAVALWFGVPRSIGATDGLTADNGTSLSAGTGEPAPQRPASGTDILPPARTGGGTLILQNIGDLDSVVVLADETTYTRAVYIRPGDQVTIPNVAAGTYEVLMMLGRDWRGDRFARAATFQQLDRAVEFAERDVGSSVEYTRVTVSIEPVTAGLVGVRATEPFQLTAP